MLITESTPHQMSECPAPPSAAQGQSNSTSSTKQLVSSTWQMKRKGGAGVGGGLGASIASDITATVSTKENNKPDTTSSQHHQQHSPRRRTSLTRSEKLFLKDFDTISDAAKRREAKVYMKTLASSGHPYHWKVMSDSTSSTMSSNGRRRQLNNSKYRSDSPTGGVTALTVSNVTLPSLRRSYSSSAHSGGNVSRGGSYGSGGSATIGNILLAPKLPHHLIASLSNLWQTPTNVMMNCTRGGAPTSSTSSSSPPVVAAVASRSAMSQTSSPYSMKKSFECGPLDVPEEQEGVGGGARAGRRNSITHDPVEDYPHPPSLSKLESAIAVADELYAQNVVNDDDDDDDDAIILRLMSVVAGSAVAATDKHEAGNNRCPPHAREEETKMSHTYKHSSSPLFLPRRCSHTFSPPSSPSFHQGLNPQQQQEQLSSYVSPDREGYGDHALNKSVSIQEGPPAATDCGSSLQNKATMTATMTMRDGPPPSPPCSPSRELPQDRHHVESFYSQPQSGDLFRRSLWRESDDGIFDEEPKPDAMMSLDQTTMLTTIGTSLSSHENTLLLSEEHGYDWDIPLSQYLVKEENKGEANEGEVRMSTTNAPGKHSRKMSCSTATTGLTTDLNTTATAATIAPSSCNSSKPSGDGGGVYGTTLQEITNCKSLPIYDDDDGDEDQDGATTLADEEDDLSLNPFAYTVLGVSSFLDQGGVGGGSSRNGSGVISLLAGQRQKKHYITMTLPLLEALRPHLPFDVRQDNFWLKYSLSSPSKSNGGLSSSSNPSVPPLTEMLEKIRFSTHTLLVIETVDGDIFGSFTSAPWSSSSPSSPYYSQRNGGGFYGSGEAFLWRAKTGKEVASAADASPAIANDVGRETPSRHSPVFTDRQQEEQPAEEHMIHRCFSMDDDGDDHELHLSSSYKGTGDDLADVVEVFPWAGHNRNIQYLTLPPGGRGGDRSRGSGRRHQENHLTIMRAPSISSTASSLSSSSLPLAPSRTLSSSSSSWSNVHNETDDHSVLPQLVIGGGGPDSNPALGGGSGICLWGDSLREGWTQACEYTFESPPLISDTNDYNNTTTTDPAGNDREGCESGMEGSNSVVGFAIANVEVWTLTPVDNVEQAEALEWGRHLTEEQQHRHYHHNHSHQTFPTPQPPPQNHHYRYQHHQQPREHHLRQQPHESRSHHGFYSDHPPHSSRTMPGDGRSNHLTSLHNDVLLCTRSISTVHV